MKEMLSLRSYGSNWLVRKSLLVLGVVTLTLVWGVKISFGEVVLKQTIMGKEYRIETVEGEPGNYWVYWGEEKLKWEPKPYYSEKLNQQGPAFYEVFAHDVDYFPNKMPLKERESLKGIDIFDMGYNFSVIPGWGYDYGSEFGSNQVSHKGYERLKKGYELVKYIRQDREYPEGDPYKKYMFFFSYPEDLSGLGFLQIQYHGLKKEDDNFMYLPTVRKVRRLATANRQDYIAGTVWRQEDNALTKPIHNYKVLGTELYRGQDFGYKGKDKNRYIGNPTLILDGIGEPAWIMEITPYREDWWFGKHIHKIGMKSWIFWFRETYDKKGRLIHRMSLPQSIIERGEQKAPFMRWDGIFSKDYKTGYTNDVLWNREVGTFMGKDILSDDLFVQRTLLQEPRTLYFWR